MGRVLGIIFVYLYCVRYFSVRMYKGIWVIDEWFSWLVKDLEVEIFEYWG